MCKIIYISPEGDEAELECSRDVAETYADLIRQDGSAVWVFDL